MTLHPHSGNGAGASVALREREALAHLAVVLQRRYGREVGVGESKRLSEDNRRHLLLRVPLIDPPPGAPSSVIVKRAMPEFYITNSDPEGASALAIVNERVGLQFLEEIGFDGAPRCVGGGRDSGIVVMEDISPFRGLDRVFLKATAAEASNAIESYASTLGRLHATSAGRYNEFHTLRQQFGRVGVMDADDLKGRLGETVGRTLDLVATVDVPLGAEARAELDQIVAVAAEPGEFRAYAHSDACPENAALLPDGTLKLLDFEYGSFNHALLDGAYARSLFPTCWCVRTVPDDVLVRADAAYRAELVKGVPAAGDDALYTRELVRACGFWVMMVWVFARDRGLLFEDIEHGTSTVRQRLVARSEAFARLSERTGHWRGFGGLCERMAAELRTLWPDLQAMDTYACFGGTGWTRELDPEAGLG